MPPPATKTYDLSTTNLKRTKAILQSPDSQTPTYSLDLSFAIKDITHNPQNHSIVLRKLSSPEPDTNNGTTTPSQKTIGTCDITFSSLTTPIHLGFGDPDLAPETVRWENVVCREKWLSNGFELGLDLGDGMGRKTFCWKRTRSVEGVGALTRNSSWLHLKMVDLGSGGVVARFVHYPFWGRKRGRFEIEGAGDGDGEWERVVVLSGVAVLEYMRKASGWSW